MKKNDVIQLAITDLTAEGSGFGRYENQAVFVAHALPGDVWSVKIIKTAKTYCVGRGETLLAPSPCRIAPDCDIHRVCGGCVSRCFSYEAECEYKAKRVNDCLSRIGGQVLSIEEFIPSPKVERYRNKAQFPVGRDESGHTILGFYAPRSHRIVPCTGCRLQPEAFDALCLAFTKYADASGATVYDEATGEGLLRHLYLRCGFATGQIMACLVVTDWNIPDPQLLVAKLTAACPQITGILINKNDKPTNVILGEETRCIYGSPTIDDRLLGVTFTLSPHSFYQVNPAAAERLFTRAAEYARAGSEDTVLDLYCGTGAVGLCAAPDAGRLIGVEIVPQAVENARRNAASAGRNNCEFICGDAAKAAELLKKRGITPTVVFLDPPRKGCEESLIQTVAQMGPQRVVYISCDPATLARDIARFARVGYMAQKATAVDLFPRTGHVETVALLGRKQVKYRVEFDVDVTDLKKPTRKRATYPEIKEYVKERFGLNVSSLNIAQVKDKCGLGKRENYYKGKDGHRVPNCPEEKEKAIIETFKHFGMV